MKATHDQDFRMVDSLPRMWSLATGLILLLALVASHARAAEEVAWECPFTHVDAQQLNAWKANAFQAEDADRSLRNLAACMGESNPFLRDEIGFAGLSAILRRGAGSDAGRKAVIEFFIDRLDAPDPEGVAHPFAILGLAELARVDRMESYLSDAEFEGLVLTAAEYLTDIDDYRAFDDDHGWRHGVAHGADLALQIVLNPRTSTTQMLRLRSAVSIQIAPRAGPAYTHGEPRRLARPVLYMAIEGELGEQDWRDWFASVSDPAPMADWADGYRSSAGLKRIHNLRAFALEVYAAARESERAELQVLADAAVLLLEKLG